jgi:Zn-finger nucleic acid-binding protein
MSSVRELHNRAMELAQLAMVARHSGELERAETLAYQAYEYETQAADLVPEGLSSEPTRAILYRSAASLAYQCKEFQAAQRLIAKALSGYPPLNLVRELERLYDQINFEQQLQARGIALEEGELDLLMEGTAVSPGTILYSEFTRRVNNLLDLIRRTAQRKMRREYQRRGRVADIYRLEPALAAPRESSFAVTLKLFHGKDQQLSLFFSPDELIDEVMTGIELLNDANEQELQKLIPENKYYRSFVVSARDMAPDGDRINLVGLTSRSKVVSLIRTRDEFVTVPVLEEGSGDAERRPVSLEGILDYATSRQQDAVGLTTDDGVQYNILVQEGLDDLVISYWKQWVRVDGIAIGDEVHLMDIRSRE